MEECMEDTWKQSGSHMVFTVTPNIDRVSSAHRMRRKRMERTWKTVKGESARELLLYSVSIPRIRSPLSKVPSYWAQEVMHI
jgi:hypothetical protein